jgi:Pyridoxamine 5'-phosphate oxidase
LLYGKSSRTVSGMELLPDWPGRTVAVLATLDGGPHAIPVSAPVRAGDRRILINLRRDRDSLARLREDPRVALLILAEGDIAFTARGRASAADLNDDYCAVTIDVDEIDDHRQAAFVVESGPDRRWVDEDERRALGERVAALRALPSPRATATAPTPA